MSPITQFDRGTDIVAIRVRRWAFLVPLAMTAVAQLVGWAPVTIVLTVLSWLVAIAIFVWLFLRPRRSPVVEDPTPAASARKPPPASPPGS